MPSKPNEWALAQSRETSEQLVAALKKLGRSLPKPPGSSFAATLIRATGCAQAGHGAKPGMSVCQQLLVVESYVLHADFAHIVERRA